jgi:hypothetical protein
LPSVGPDNYEDAKKDGRHTFPMLSVQVAFPDEGEQVVILLWPQHEMPVIGLQTVGQDAHGRLSRAWSIPRSSHLVTKLHYTALVGFDLRQMEGDVSVEILEEWDPTTNQDRQDRIANFVG